MLINPNHPGKTPQPPPRPSFSSPSPRPAAMAQRVELALVRFSDIEKAYYFYDPRHPQAIQFAINGNWESWDVGWVKQ